MPQGLSELYDEVIKAGHIHDSMAISSFLNPIEEAEEEGNDSLDPDEVLEEVLGEHLGHQLTQNDDEEQSEQVTRTAKEAQEALQILIEYAEGQDALSSNHMRALERLEMAIEGIQVQSQQQSTLDSWIM
jgi:hypothetical protein